MIRDQNVGDARGIFMVVVSIKKLIINLIMVIGIVVSGMEPVMAATVTTPNKTYSLVKDYDVVICGAEPEGIAAAISASKNGLKTLIIEERDIPGGLYTAGMLAMLDMNYDGGSENLAIVNQGWFASFYNAVGHETAIDCKETEAYFSNILAKCGVDAYYNVTSIRPNVTDGSIVSIDFQWNGQSIHINTEYVIDAMLDAPIVRMGGADYWVGREDLGLKNYAASTLVFSVKGADWNKICRYLEEDEDYNSGSSKNSAWGYKKLINYKPVTSSSKYQLRGLNMARQLDGSIVINAFQIFNVNSLSEANKQSEYDKACLEVPYIVQYLRQNAVGFENAILDQIAEELYVREGVRIVGENTLTAEDCFTGRNFANKVAYGSYPMDLQSASRDFAGGNGLSFTSVYTLPMGIMIPTKLKNALVVGRSASYDSIAHSSARTVPVGMALGEAAGAMCKVAKKEKISFKEMNRTQLYYEQVQKTLISQGVTLNDPINVSNEEAKNWSYGAIQNLRQQGFLPKVYKGKKGYGCNELADYDSFGNIASLMVFHSNLPISTLGSMSKTLTLPITEDKLVKTLNQIMKVSYNQLVDFYKAGMISEKTYKAVSGAKAIYNSHAYSIMSDLVNYLRKQNPRPRSEELVHNDLR